MRRLSIPPSFCRQRGLSLVELMVGITVGLFVVAAAIVLVVSQLGENRRVLLETQVQQDLRATADIITRDLRRAGYTDESLNNIWLPDPPQQSPIANAWMPLSLGDGTDLDYRYKRLSDQQFRLNWTPEEGIIYRQIGSSPRQPLTDRNTLQVTWFRVGYAPDRQTTALVACAKLCPGDTQDCWPTVRVRDLIIEIRGRAVSDPAVEREINSRVRLRNDAVAFNAAGSQVCP